MNNRERDPLESQVRILYGKSGGRCAYPGCATTLTISSNHTGDLPKNVGKVAHISAASPGGPRYDASTTPEERRSERNLLLLCGPHHDAVDTQMNFHTREWLLAAKAAHETRVGRGADYAMGATGYAQLELVCAGLVVLADDASSEISQSVSIPIEIERKIELNDLGSSRGRIQLGLAKQNEVARFIQSMDSISPGFGDKLAAHFKVLYYRGVAESLTADDLFNSILGAALSNCGVNLTAEIEAAALATVAHLFAICEIFEHEHSAA